MKEDSSRRACGMTGMMEATFLDVKNRSSTVIAEAEIPPEGANGVIMLGDTAAVTALLDRLLHHAHILKCGPRSWRTRIQTDLRQEVATK